MGLVRHVESKETKLIQSILDARDVLSSYLV